MTAVQVRSATPDDSAAIAAIYDHHARNGTASFDLLGPPADAWAGKIADVLARGWPFLVAETDDEVGGFAYATQFRDRPAYVHACEDSIYVAAALAGQGVGSTLLPELKRQARGAGFERMIAVIGGAEPASVALHSKFGFRECGRLTAVGFKFGRRLDSLYMECALAGD